MKRSDDDKGKLLGDLKRIAGQVHGIEKMIEEDRYCVDILIQLAAVKAGINKIGLSILETHTRGCVAMAIKEGKGDRHIEELVEVCSKFVK